MILEPNCPVCDHTDWQIIGTRVYCRNDIKLTSPYIAKRLRILFEIWAPSKDEIEIHAAFCRQCGFVTHLPRPTGDDVQNKYLFAHKIGSDLQERSANDVSEINRAISLFQSLKHLIDDRKNSRILDFGGNDGRLMSQFLHDGHRCELCDYSNVVIPGVQKIAETEKEIPGDRVYDLIICSHVVEHLADPKPTLQKLAQHLTDAGRIYVEVPMEIWGEAPLPDEPVTHVNYFTPGSMNALLQQSGFAVQSCKLSTYLHPAGHRSLCVEAIAALGRADLPLGGRKIDIHRYLAPGWREEWIRANLFGRLQPTRLLDAARRRLFARGGRAA